MFWSKYSFLSIFVGDFITFCRMNMDYPSILEHSFQLGGQALDILMFPTFLKM